MSERAWFDSDAFYAALDAHRESRRYTWRKVASEAGVSASTLTRMAQGKRPDVDSLARLARWASLDADDYFRPVRSTDVGPAEPLAMVSTYLKSDKNLTPEAATALDELLKATYSRLRSQS